MPEDPIYTKALPFPTYNDCITREIIEYLHNIVELCS